MKFLFDTSNIEKSAAEMEITDYGQLITPLTQMRNRGYTFAIDNGCFRRFDEVQWLRILHREREFASECQFVALPDVVGCPSRTLALFDHFKLRSSVAGYKLAYVLQDGQEKDLVPWDEIAYVFVGGTDEFKLGEDAVKLIRASQGYGKKVHVGRINSKDRFDKFEALNCDSCDGTGLCRFTWQRINYAHPQFEQVLS